MPSGVSSTPVVKPPPLTAEEQRARAARLQADHEAYIGSIATMRNLPRLRSTIAGAGGKTNEQARLAEEREAGRQARLRAAAAAAAQQQQAKETHDAKVARLAERQARKKRRRDRKTAARAKHARTENARSEDEGGNTDEDEGVESEATA